MPNTPIVKIDNIYYKREDLNITGSTKDRAIQTQLKNAIAQKYSSAVISSTGNAAISAIHFCRQHSINLTIFLSPKIDPKKLSLIRQKTKNIVIDSRPISRAFKQAKKNHSYNLRQSTDPVALKGYRHIGLEIQKQLPQITDIFIPVGSGATLLGISSSLPPTAKIFAVQPASHCPIASIFDQKFQEENHTITTSLSAKSLPLKNKVVTAIKNSQGFGLVVQNRQVENQQAYLKKNHLLTSTEGALALAGYKKALRRNLAGNFPLILLTGALR